MLEWNRGDIQALHFASDPKRLSRRCTRAIEIAERDLVCGDVLIFDGDGGRIHAPSPLNRERFADGPKGRIRMPVFELEFGYVDQGYRDADFVADLLVHRESLGAQIACLFEV